MTAQRARRMNFLELKLSYQFRPRLVCSRTEIDAVVQRSRSYDSWTFSKLLNTLLDTATRDGAMSGGPYDTAVISMLSQGFSGATVFSIRMATANGEGELHTGDAQFSQHARCRMSCSESPLAFILKVGPYDQLRQERENYSAHVVGVLLSETYPRLIAAASFIDRTGALLFERVSDARTLFDLYAELDATQLEQAISALFSELSRAWYNLAVPKRVNLLETYQLAARREKFLQSVRQLVPPEHLRAPKIHLPGADQDDAGRNPFEVIDHGDIGRMFVLESMIHDDLSAYNVLIDGDQPYRFKLIDFASSRVRPTLQDFAKLETSIFFLLHDRQRHDDDWCTTDDIQECVTHPVFKDWFRIATLLVNDVVTEELDGLHEIAADEQKLLRAISTIRRHARQFAYQDWKREYMLALLTWTLRATYWHDSSPAKRVLAYYMSSLLAARLLDSRGSGSVAPSAFHRP